MPDRDKPSILYSACTQLAYQISEKYYGSVHYIWAASELGTEVDGDNLRKNPTTSVPFERYKCLKREVDTGDLHGVYIGQQKLGLRYGAVEKYKCGEISKPSHDDILKIIELSSCKDYEPLIYAMVYSDVADLVVEPEISDLAHPCSSEFLIRKLPRKLFRVHRF